MFAFAFIIGLYANTIFLLGLLHLLQKGIVVVYTFIFIFLITFFWPKFDEKLDWKKVKKELVILTQQNKLYVIAVTVAVTIMVLGCLVPETAFDALWYHLTLPKLYLEYSQIKFFSGNLLYYSTMPKLVEMLYLAALSFGSDVLAHFVHLGFALLTCVAIYLITRHYSSRYSAVLAVVIFLSNIVVLWEATTAYIDLARAFFEVMAIWGVLKYRETKKTKWLVESALLFGLAIQTKLLAVTSFPLFIVLLVTALADPTKKKLSNCLLFLTLSLVVPSGWFIFSFVHTGNPIYPIFSTYPLSLGKDIFAFPAVFSDLVTIFVTSADPISPIYLIIAPTVILIWKKTKTIDKLFILLSCCSLVIWTLSPKTGGGRFLVPYLPLLSITSGMILFHLQKYQKELMKISAITVLLLFVTAVGYRSLAQLRNSRVILGLEGRDEYLSKKLNFEFGDFYDTDRKVKEIVGPDKVVLLYGFHNLYYMNVHFIDASFAQPGDSFDYIATKDSKLPQRFSYWQPIYYNALTKVTIYTNGQRWIY